MGHAKIVTADLDSIRRELSVRGLRFVVALLVCWKIDFSGASTGGTIQLYGFMASFAIRGKGGL